MYWYLDILKMVKHLAAYALNAIPDMHMNVLQSRPELI